MDVVGDIDAAKKLIAKDEDSRTENLSESENEQDQQEVSSSLSWLLQLLNLFSVCIFGMTICKCIGNSIMVPYLDFLIDS